MKRVLEKLTVPVPPYRMMRASVGRADLPMATLAAVVPEVPSAEAPRPTEQAPTVVERAHAARRHVLSRELPSSATPEQRTALTEKRKEFLARIDGLMQEIGNAPVAEPRRQEARAPLTQAEIEMNRVKERQASLRAEATRLRALGKGDEAARKEREATSFDDSVKKYESWLAERAKYQKVEVAQAEKPKAKKQPAPERKKAQEVGSERVMLAPSSPEAKRIREALAERAAQQTPETTATEENGAGEKQAVQEAPPEKQPERGAAPKESEKAASDIVPAPTFDFNLKSPGEEGVFSITPEQKKGLRDAYQQRLAEEERQRQEQKQEEKAAAPKTPTEVAPREDFHEEFPEAPVEPKPAPSPERREPRERPPEGFFDRFKEFWFQSDSGDVALHRRGARVFAAISAYFQGRAGGALEDAEDRIGEYRKKMQSSGPLKRLWYGNRIAAWEKHAAELEGRIEKWNAIREKHVGWHGEFMKEVARRYDREIAPYRGRMEGLKERMDVQSRILETLLEKRREALALIAKTESEEKTQRITLSAAAKRAIKQLQGHMKELDERIQRAEMVLDGCQKLFAEASQIVHAGESRKAAFLNDTKFPEFEGLRMPKRLTKAP
ncbi:MAG: hypothetical protein IT406_03075 [Candidatus Yanofskybacteria bacterium]|nr:hypothetical protein [Candidatus Yanofskybacteria bacterium]